MSNEEKAKNLIEPIKEKVTDLIATLMALKADKPKVFYSIVGGGVFVVLLLMMSGGGDSNKPKLPENKIQNLVVGQKYVLKSANTYDEKSTVRLVAVPGEMKAFDDTEEADRVGACQHMPQGTPVSVIELQDAYGTKNAFVKVQMEEGSCKGSSGWALSIDVQ